MGGLLDVCLEIKWVLNYLLCSSFSLVAVRGFLWPMRMPRYQGEDKPETNAGGSSRSACLTEGELSAR